MASFGGVTEHEAAAAAVTAEPEPDVPASADVVNYVPSTPLEAKMADALKAITTAEGRVRPKFLKIQLQFPKVAKSFEAMKGAFTEIDTDKSSTIEIDEATTALTKMGASATSEEIGAIFAAADEDSNSKLTFQEFVVFLCVGSLVGKLPNMPELDEAFKVAVDAFDIFDVGNQGVIVLSEVQATFKDIGSPDTLVARMNELDKDSNGYGEYTASVSESHGAHHRLLHRISHAAFKCCSYLPRISHGLYRLGWGRR